MALPLPGSPAVATADASGAAAFSFPPPAAGQLFTGTLSISNAPGSCVFTVLVGGQPVGMGIGPNSIGPYQTSQGTPLAVEAFGLQPGVQYQCNYVGQLTDGDLDAIPDAQTSIVQPPNALFLGTREVNPAASDAITIAVDSSWRAIWVVTLAGFGAGKKPASLVGQQSTLDYASTTPPYFVAPATFQRFSLLAGIDTIVVLGIDNLSGSDDRFWYGADLADVDVGVYDGGGGGFPTNYALETGGNLQQLERWFGTFSDDGLQAVYYDTDTTITLASGMLVMGSVGTTPGTAVPGNAKVLQTDNEGRLVLAPGSLSGDVTIVSPLDGSGWVEVDVKTSVLPTNAAQETGGNLATLAATVESVSGSPRIATQPSDDNGNPWDAITTGSLNGGELGVIIDPLHGGVQITNPLDGSGYVETDVLAAAFAGASGSTPAQLVALGGTNPISKLTPIAVNTGGNLEVVLTSPLDGSGWVETDVKAAAFAGATGATAPADAVLVGGTDGTDLRGLLLDSSGRIILAPGSVASSVAITSPLDGSGWVEVDVKTGTVSLTGTLPAPAAPSNSNSAGNVTSLHVKAAAGTLYGISGYTSVAQFVQVHDANALVSGTTVPAVVFFVPAAGSFALDYEPSGRAFATGIFVAFSSTEAVFTTGTAAWADAQYV